MATKQNFTKPKINFNNPKYHNPPNNTNDELKNQFFLFISEGNMNSITEFLTKNKMNIFGLKDDNDNNVLHMIIKNDSLTPQQKYELTKLCIDIGANVSESNKYNITPLHLACQYQLTHVCDLLIKSNSDINKKDNSGKTPFHYAVVGNTTKCPEYKKPKSISNNSKQPKLNINNILKVIKESLIPQVLESNNNFLKDNLLYIYHNLSNYKNISPSKYDEFHSSAILKINTALSKQNNENRIDKIISILLEEKKNIVSELTKMTDTTNIFSFKFEPNTKNGWTPDESSHQNNKIMEKLDFMNIMDNEKGKIREIKIDQINYSILTFLDDFDNIYPEFENNFCHIIAPLLLIKQHSGSDPNLSSEDLKNLNNIILPQNTTYVSNNINTSNDLIPYRNDEKTYLNAIYTHSLQDVIRAIHFLYETDIEPDDGKYINKKKNERLWIAFAKYFFSFEEFDRFYKHINNVIYKDDKKFTIDYTKIDKKDSPIVNITYINDKQNNMIAKDPPDIPKTDPLSQKTTKKKSNMIKKINDIFDDELFNLDSIDYSPYVNGKPVLGNNSDSDSEKDEYRKNGRILSFKDVYNETKRWNSTNMTESFKMTCNFPFGFILQKPYSLDHSLLITKNIYYFNKIKMNYNDCKVFVGYMIENIMKLKAKINNIESEKLNDILNSDVSRILLNILNISTYISDIHREINKIRKFHDFVKNFVHYNKTIPKYDFFKKDINDKINALEKMFQHIIGLDYYKRFTLEIFNWIKNIIKIMENHVSVKILRNVLSRTNNIIQRINNIFNKTYVDFKIPISLDEFNSLLTDDYSKFHLMKLNIIKLLPFNDPLYNFTYFGNNDIDNKEGYILDSDIAKSYLFTGISEIDANNNPTYTFNKSNNTIIDNNGNKVITFSRIAEQLASDVDIDSNTYPILFLYHSNLYTTFVKYQIIQSVMFLVYDLMENNTDPNLSSVFIDFENSYKPDNDEKDHSIILTIVGNYVKNILDNNIQEIVYSCANNIILGMIKGNFEKTTYTQIYKELKNSVLPDFVDYKVNLKEIELDLFQTFNPKKKSLIIEPINDSEYINRIYSYNYYNPEIINELCFISNHDIINLLVMNGANYNIVDSSNKSPINLAIDLRNTNLIKYFIEKKIINKNNSKYFSEYVFNEYKKLLTKNYLDAKTITANVNSSVFNKFKSIHQNLPLHSDYIFGVSLCLLNHYIFSEAENFNSKWSFNDFEQIKNLIKVDYNELIPLANVYKSLNKNERDQTLVSEYYDSIGRYKNENDEIQIFNDNSNHLLNDLKKELAILSQKPVLSSYEYVRRKKITKQINDIESNPNIEKINDSNIQNGMNDALAIKLEKIKNIDKRALENNYHDFIGTYEYLSDELVMDSPDFFTYPNLWMKYLDLELYTRDYVNFVPASFDLLNKQKNSIIMKYHINNVLPIIKTLIEYPREYNGVNTTLDFIIKIIEHVVKNFVQPVLFYEIVLNLSEYTDNSFGTDEIRTNRIIREIQEFDNHKIIRYLFVDMPIRLIKKILNIFEEGDDEDNIDIDQDLNYIKTILGLMKSMKLVNDTPFMDNLDNILSKYKDYYNLVINGLYNFLHNYLLYLRNNIMYEQIINSIDNL